MSVSEIRNICKRVSPYIVHQWREVCEELGVADAVLDNLERDYGNSRMSELAFQGLCRWQEMVGRSASREKLLKVTQFLGLRRAEEELKTMSQKRLVPYMGRPVTAPSAHDVSVNRQAKQKALADRLSKPKPVVNTEEDSMKKKKVSQGSVMTGVNTLAMQVTPSKPSDICEVKLKITVKGIQRVDRDDMEQTHDAFKSTKDDFKHTCYSFVKLVRANMKAHFKDLKDLLGYEGITVQRLSQVGFTINAFVLCFNLGAFEILYQNYVTGRLKKIVQTALVTKEHLDRLNACRLELSVDIDEGLINKYRDILLVRGPVEDANEHPVDVIVDYFRCDDDENVEGSGQSLDLDEIRNFDLQTWRREIYDKITIIDERWKIFKDSMKDLLVTLRIVLPRDRQEVHSLQDVINCYHFVKQSKSMARGKSIDLMYEYIAIVNIIRLTVQGIGEKILLVTFDETLDPESCEKFNRLLGEIEEMLEPSKRFEIDESISTLFKLTGMEREKFEGVLCYLPRLVEMLYTLCDTLNLKKGKEYNENDKQSKDADVDNDTLAGIDEADEDEDGENKENCPEENNNVLRELQDLTLKSTPKTTEFSDTLTVHYIDK
ncbi:hypothetical protein ACF0H5_001896 [Mactra antiquata]